MILGPWINGCDARIRSVLKFTLIPTGIPEKDGPLVLVGSFVFLLA